MHRYLSRHVKIKPLLINTRHAKTTERLTIFTKQNISAAPGEKKRLFIFASDQSGNPSEAIFSYNNMPTEESAQVCLLHR